MEFLLSPDLIEFRSVLRKFLSTDFSADTRRARLVAGGRRWSAEDDRSWSGFAELGALAAGLPEEAGGLGFGALARAVVLEEVGRALAHLPVLENLTAASWLALCGRSDLALKIAEGAARYTFSVGDGAHVERTEGTATLTGVLSLVPSVGQSATLLVSAPIGGGSDHGVIAVELDAAVSVQAVDTFDLLREFAEVTFKGAPATVLGPDCSPDPLRFIAAVHAVSELSGIAARVVELTVEYVKTRQQFGRTVGSFQAIQHKLADMHLRAEQVGSLGRFAAWCVDSDPQQLADAALAAKGMAAEYVPWICEQSIQLHGGIGFTFEYDLHHYLRRALVLSRAFLPANECYAELGRKLLAA